MDIFLNKFCCAHRLRSRLLRTFCYGRWGRQEDVDFDIDVKISAAESMIDVSHRGDPATDIQIATGRDRALRDFDAAGVTGADGLLISLLVEFSQKVELIILRIAAADAIDPLVEP